MGYKKYWAKSDRKDPAKWRPYPEHIAAVAACAEAICAARPLLVQRIADLLRVTPQEAIEWVIVAAALHDVGKLCCLFQVKNPTGFTRTYGTSPIPYATSARKSGGQAIYSKWNHGNDGYYLYLIWKSCQQILNPLPPSMVTAFYVGSWHHGSTMPISRKDPKYQEIESWLELAKTNQWSEVSTDMQAVNAFVTDVTGTYKGPTVIEPQKGSAFQEVLNAIVGPTKEDFQEALQIVAGIIATADWKGSDEDHFPLLTNWPEPLRDYPSAWADPSIRNAALNAVILFNPLPTQLQSFAPEAPSSLQENIHKHQGRLVIMEAPTGDGKTEAALMLFESLLKSNLVDRFVFGLPTQATTNMMHTRIERHFKGAFGEEATVILGHGDAKRRLRYLKDEYVAKLIAQGGDPNDLTATDFGDAWFQTGKRYMLSNASVITVDQILMMILKGHLHKFVRQMSLCTAFLVIDEVHDLDTYMMSLLAYGLQVLARSGTHVALLSATLTDKSRNLLTESFLKGLDLKFNAETLAFCPEATRVTTVYQDGSATNVGYPSMRKPSSIDVKTIRHRWEKQDNLDRVHPKDLETMVSDLIDSLKKGACVGWIRNTVWDVQETLREIERQAPALLQTGQVLSLHASLCAKERQAVEKRLTDILGKDSKLRQPLLVIGTNILGMSLDIDFDRLVVDLTTLDNLIQAIGRLHRHQQVRPTGFETKVVEVFIPDTMTTQNIYDLTNTGNQFPLYRTWKWVQTNPQFVDPDDVRTLIAQVMGFTNPPLSTDPGWDRYNRDERSAVERGTWARGNLAVRADGKLAPEEGALYRAPTRDGIPYATILTITMDGTILSVPHLPGKTLDISSILKLKGASKRDIFESVKGADWKIWKDLQEMVSAGGARRSTFLVGEISWVAGDPVGWDLTRIWADAPVYPLDVVFVPVDLGIGEVTRTRDSHSKIFSVLYSDMIGLQTQG